MATVDRTAAVRGRAAGERGGAAASAGGRGGAAAPADEPLRAVDGRIRDLRGNAGAAARGLLCTAGDLVVVSGLPGSGKSTLIRRMTGSGGGGCGVDGVDSQDARERWAGRLPLLPYALYRPLVRLAHYAGLRRLLRAGRSVVVHDCGTQSWVRRWLAREARTRGRRLHLVLVDVTPETARAGQRTRGRTVSRYAFARHRRAIARLLGAVESGRLPAGCHSAALLDRDAADACGPVVLTAGVAVPHRRGLPGG